jgi:hypothetical protein
MAFMNQSRKAERAPVIKAILKKYGVKGTLSVRNHSTLVLNVKGGEIDFIGNSNRVCGNDHFQVSRGFKPNTSGYEQVNPYWFQDHYDGVARDFLTEVFAALRGEDFFDETNSQIDYFHCSHYCDVNIGSWNKPYELVK